MLACEEPLERLERSGEGFLLTTPRQTLSADKVILAPGGQSYPGCGTTGDGYAWAAALGHTIVPPRPALVPLRTDAPWVHALSGITIPDVLVRVMPGDGGRAALAQRRGSFLFTHFGLSGPVVLDVSRAVSGHTGPEQGPRGAGGKGDWLRVPEVPVPFSGAGARVVPEQKGTGSESPRCLSPFPAPGSESPRCLSPFLVLVCDFLPRMKPDELSALVARECAAAGKRQLSTILANWLPQRLAETLVRQAGLTGTGSESPRCLSPFPCRAAELSAAGRRRLVQAVKGLPIPIAGTLGFKKAEVTAGGVALDEVDSRNMQSKLIPNLYIAGELLDLDGPIGGYNFQIAFSTGYLAGESV